MYALVDCNNFYVSCERVFQPKLWGKPVVVLSNNDGCIISRSQEAKDLGVKMGDPYFKVRPLLEAHDVQVFSSNYELYGDMSGRVMRYLASQAPAAEVYSIDEVFLDLHGMAQWFGPLAAQAQNWRTELLRRTHIPTCVGIASTKTLAKLANHLAKKRPAENGVVVLDTPERRQRALAQVSVADVWGIGRRLAPKLQAVGINTAADLARCPESWVRKHLGGVVGWRLVRELQGHPCHGFHPSDEARTARQSIACTRSFGRPITEPAHLLNALSAFATRAAEKLRRQNSAANLLTVFISRNRFGPEPPPHSRSLQFTLPQATNDTAVLLQHIQAALPKLWQPGTRYVKAGVVLDGLETAGQQQADLFQEADFEHRQGLLSCLDKLNRQHGANLVGFAAALRAKRGAADAWAGLKERRNGAYTTNWNEVWRIGEGVYLSSC